MLKGLRKKQRSFVVNRRSLVFLFTLGIFSSSLSNAASSIHTAYDCSNEAYAYREDGTGGEPADCSCTDASSRDYPNLGPSGICTVSVNDPGSSGSGHVSSSSTGGFGGFGGTQFCSCRSLQGVSAYASNVLKASDCATGELYSGAYGCVPAETCTTSTLMPTVSTYTISRDTNARNQVSAVVIDITNAIKGDLFTVGVASQSQVFSFNTGDTAASIATRIANYFRGKTTMMQSASGFCSGGPSTISTSTDGATVKLVHHACNGPAGGGVSRLSPICTTPTVPAPTAAPTTAPTPVCLSNGATCSTGSDCCTSVCDKGGNQPYRNSFDCSSASCTVGVNFTSNYTGGNAAAPAGGTPNVTPTKVCLPNAASVPDANTVLPPISMSGKLDPALALYQNGYITCMLSASDKHRVAGACQCAGGYVPKILTNTEFNSVAFNLNRNGTKLEAMWAQVVDLLTEHPRPSKEVKKVYDLAASDAQAYTWDDGACTMNSSTANSSGICETTNVSCPGNCMVEMGNNGPFAPATCGRVKCMAGSGSTTGGTTTGGTTTGSTTSSNPVTMYSDENPVVWKATAAQGYGVASTGAGANSMGGNRIACVKNCTQPSTLGADFNSCACANPGETYSDATGCTNVCATTGPEGSYPNAAGICTCPDNYAPTADNKCRPKVNLLPEYYTDSSTDGYPICGPKRLPMTYSRASNDGVSSHRPRFPGAATGATGSSGLNYPYTKLVAGVPSYFYNNYPHCACAGTDKDVQESPPGTDVAVSASKFYPDDYESVSARDGQNRPKTTAPIAIALNPTQDGRRGDFFRDGLSQCGCPNVNEEMVYSPDVIGGAYCRPKIDPTDENTIFSAKYTPGDEFSASDEIKDSSGKIVATVKMASSANPQVATLDYTRGSWKCQVGMTRSGNKCVFDASLHKCDETSAVSGAISGATMADRFNNTRNKKLACCLNLFDQTNATGSGVMKFDCIDNSVKRYQDFNDLWSSADDAADGGQMNAFILANANQRPVTGFYTLNGERCEGFSEFSTTAIQPGVVNPLIVMGQGLRANGSASADAFQAKGSAIPKPSSSAYSTMASKLGANQSKVPTTVSDRRRCPILVRAALVTGCPSNPQVSTAPRRSYSVYDGSGNITARRCGVASSVQVQIRVEQVWEIAGQPLAQPIDTVVDPKSASTISIDRIIADKYGNQCGPGMTRQGDNCVF